MPRHSPRHRQTPCGCRRTGPRYPDPLAIHHAGPIKTSGVEIFRHPLSPSGCDFHICIDKTKPGWRLLSGRPNFGLGKQKPGPSSTEPRSLRVVAGNPVPRALRTAINPRRISAGDSATINGNVCRIWCRATFTGGNEGYVSHDQFSHCCSHYYVFDEGMQDACIRWNGGNLCLQLQP